MHNSVCSGVCRGNDVARICMEKIDFCCHSVFSGSLCFEIRGEIFLPISEKFKLQHHLFLWKNVTSVVAVTKYVLRMWDRDMRCKVLRFLYYLIQNVHIMSSPLFSEDPLLCSCFL